MSERAVSLLRETNRWALIAAHIAGLCGYTSRKHAAKDAARFAQQGILRRFAMLLPGKQGRPLVAFYRHAAPHPRAHYHIYATALLHVALQTFWRDAGLTSEFLYPTEFTTGGGIIPDAAFLMHKCEKTLLTFAEEDSGTETLRTLTAKLERYAKYYDQQTYRHDFPHAKGLNGFRVCIVTPPGRVRHLLDLLQREDFGFVLVTTHAAIQMHGIGARIWQTTSGEPVDLLGRTGEQREAKLVVKPGEKDEASTPHGAKGNPLVLEAPNPTSETPNTQEDLDTPTGTDV